MVADVVVAAAAVGVVVILCIAFFFHIFSLFFLFRPPGSGALLCFALCVCRLVDRRSVGRW